MENNKEILNKEIEKWWRELSMVVRAFSGSGLPALDADQLWQSEVGRQLNILLRVANGELDRAEMENVYAVGNAMKVVYSLLLYHPAPPGQKTGVPWDYFDLPVGQLYLLADVWMDRDFFMTLSEASEITGRSLSNLSNLVARRKLMRITDPSEPNPTYATRVRWSQIRLLSKAGKLADLSDEGYKTRLYQVENNHPRPLDGTGVIEVRESFDANDWLSDIIEAEHAGPDQDEVDRLLDAIQSAGYQRPGKTDRSGN